MAPRQCVRLDGLRTQPQYNHHVAVRLEEPQSGRVPVRVLTNGKVLSVREDACHPTTVPGRTKMITQDCLASELELMLHVGRLVAQPELVAHIISFLRVQPVDMLRVRVVGASSTGEGPRCSPAFALDASQETWWLSAHTMPAGRGAEWVEFDLGDEPVVIQQIHLTIPPLPQGPLSVRHFHLEGCADDPALPAAARKWRRASHDLTTLDCGSAQIFALVRPLEHARYVRIVCTCNAAAADEARAALGFGTAPPIVGFFSLAFA